MEIQLIPVNQISIPKERQRREIDPELLAKLADSIDSHSLMHPVVVRKVNGDWELVAGERRIKAMQVLWDTGAAFRCNSVSIPPGMVPAVTLGDLPYLLARKCELEENTRREDLTWQERAAATAEIMEIEKGLAAEAGQPPPTVADIAEEVRGSRKGGSQENTRREIIVSRHLDKPEIAKAKSLDDAFKLLKRQEGLEKSAALAQEIGRTFNNKVHKLYQGDFRDVCAGLDSEIFDVVVTDPIYGIGADTFGDGGGAAPGGGHSYGDDYEDWLTQMGALATESYRLCKPNAHLYIFCDVHRFSELTRILSFAEWKVFRTPIIWHKPNGNRIPWVTQGPQRKYEIILYAMKGDRPVNTIEPDVFTARQDENLGHQAQKPVEAYVNLLKRSVRPGDAVVDFCCGTGPIFPAAHQLKCSATGIELDEAFYGIAAKRIMQLENPQ